MFILAQIQGQSRGRRKKINLIEPKAAEIH
jgi:hypothetical protein